MSRRHPHTDRDDTSGFTLVELSVVVLVIAALVAIAVLGYVQAQQGAKGRAATANLRVALSSVKTLHAEAESYLVTDVPSTVARLLDVEPGLRWQTAASTRPVEISVLVDGDTAALATRSANGHCYYVVDDVGEGVGTAFGRSNATAVSCASVLDTATPAITWGGSPQEAGW